MLFCELKCFWLQTLESAASHAESKYKALQREMEVIRERHDGEMHRLELAHSRYNKCSRELESCKAADLSSCFVGLAVGQIGGPQTYEM